MRENELKPGSCRRQLPPVQENDRRVHQNLVRMMDRRLSNVQLQQHLYEADSQSQERCNGGSPRNSLDQEHRRSVVQQPKSARSSVGRSDSASDRGNDRYAGYYLGYVGQAAHKRRRTTFWETLTGLVCSLGALASRAAKMATRRGDPL
ncbi:hypothetical protein KM043_010316 [Ampulex compressa]|nr:hypothetical protein KM043_010316 [Ampulex compressa]